MQRGGIKKREPLENSNWNFFLFFYFNNLFKIDSIFRWLEEIQRVDKSVYTTMIN